MILPVVLKIMDGHSNRGTAFPRQWLAWVLAAIISASSTATAAYAATWPLVSLHFARKGLLTSDAVRARGMFREACQRQILSNDAIAVLGSRKEHSGNVYEGCWVLNVIYVAVAVAARASLFPFPVRHVLIRYSNTTLRTSMVYVH